MRKQKHTFYCENCQSPCIIYKKGRNHRVLVCPNCGVLATNGMFSSVAGLVGQTAKSKVKNVGKPSLKSTFLPFLSDDEGTSKHSEGGGTGSRTPLYSRSNSLERIKYALGGK